mmetsp:Transcript_45029/g.112803  ORF Transcript_45029/g.112803 Transcript_45029/m.112803 type:complete len:87 (-) Transcript_45029:144-404(-)
MGARHSSVKFATLRVVFSLVAHPGLHCERTDVDCAFLYAKLEDDIWIADFKSALGATFDIKDLGTCRWLLGMAVERNLWWKHAQSL